MVSIELKWVIDHRIECSVAFEAPGTKMETMQILTVLSTVSAANGRRCASWWTRHWKRVCQTSSSQVAVLTSCGRLTTFDCNERESYRWRSSYNELIKVKSQLANVIATRANRGQTRTGFIPRRFKIGTILRASSSTFNSDWNREWVWSNLDHQGLGKFILQLCYKDDLRSIPPGWSKIVGPRFIHSHKVVDPQHLLCS